MRNLLLVIVAMSAFAGCLNPFSGGASRVITSYFQDDNHTESDCVIYADGKLFRVLQLTRETIRNDTLIVSTGAVLRAEWIMNQYQRRAEITVNGDTEWTIN